MKKIISIIIIIGIAFSFSCSSIETTVKQENKEKPNWIYNVPQDESYYYFVGSSNIVDTINEGEGQAISQVEQKLATVIGARVSTSVEQSETYKTGDGNSEYEATLNSLIKIESSSIVKNLEEKDRFIENKNGQYVVYLLYQISRKDVKKEQQRIEKLYKEQIDAIFVPEKKGNESIAKKDYFAAVKYFLQSAKNASQSDYENKNIVIERNIDKLITLLSRFNGELVFPDGKVYKGEDLSSPIKYRLTYNYNNNKYPVFNAPVTFFLRKMNQKGNIEGYEWSGTTNKKGEVLLNNYIPPYAGDIPVVSFLDINDLVRDLDQSVDKKLDSKLDIVQKNISYLKFSKTIKVTSKTIANETVIYSNFYDMDNNKVQVNLGNFEAELSKIGVKILSSGLISNYSEEDLSKNSVLNELRQKGIKRILLINGDVTKKKDYSGKVFVNVEISIKIIDLQSNTTKIINKKGSGSAEKLSNAITTAYIKVIDGIVKELTNYL